MIHVVDPGLLTTVQDSGRWGSQELGVPVSGPMDWVSHRLANRIVGNDHDAATLEVTLVGPVLEFRDETSFAVVGAEFELWLDGKAVPETTSVLAVPGSRLQFGRRGAGARAYLAVGGGIDVSPTLGSRSTHLAGGLGGLGGRALRRGDQLEVGAISGEPLRGGCRWLRPMPMGGSTVRVLAGEEEGLFDGATVSRFADVQYIVAPESNRMGYCLVGPRIELLHTQPLLSSVTAIGTIQVPPSGQPVLLMADRQTTGGYAKMGVVITADLPAAGQLGPGDWIAFRWCERLEAVAALIDLEQQFMELS